MRTAERSSPKSRIPASASHGDIAVARAPFGQVDSRLERRYEGTGIGLPLAKSLVELHGGTLEI
jgi:two-component system cell cycle sensor histidine kinase PleC